MKAIILFSGGIDSTSLLTYALSRGRDCLALSFDYGQRHKVELEAAKAITKKEGVLHTIIKIDPMAFGRSSLVSTLSMSKNRSPEEISSGGIPNSYVPARNTLFLAYAASHAEMFEADEIYFGPNVTDYNAYPDCRKTFVQAFQSVLDVATESAIDGCSPTIVAPFLYKTKAEIISEATALSAPLDLSFSCYDPTEEALHCGECDACILRKEGFEKANIADPTKYRALAV